MDETRLTVLGDSTALAQEEVTVLEGREVSQGELLEELGGLPLGLHGEGLVVVKLDASKGGGGENTSDSGVA
mgnify:CR=1 FL=1|jgi:hypothetical protein